MEILGLVPYIYDRLGLFILIFSRISTLFATFVLFRRDFVNSRIIISLSAILTFYVLLANQYPAMTIDSFSLSVLIQLAVQILIGFMAGMILNIVFEIFTSVGQIISTQIGFSMATLIDPRFGAITPLTLFYSYITIIIFMGLNGHLLMIKFIMDSFTVLPIDKIVFPTQLLMNILQYTNVIFSGSISLSIAIIVSILLTNLTIAVMTRFAQQFNIFSIGISITIIFGLIIIYLTFGVFIDNAARYIDAGLSFLQMTLMGIS